MEEIFDVKKYNMNEWVLYLRMLAAASPAVDDGIRMVMMQSCEPESTISVHSEKEW